MSISKRVGRFLEVPIVRFVHSKACRRLGGLVRIVRFEHPNARIGGLLKFGKFVLSAAKRVGGLQKFGEFV